MRLLESNHEEVSPPAVRMHAIRHENHSLKLGQTGAPVVMAVVEDLGSLVRTLALTGFCLPAPSTLLLPMPPVDLDCGLSVIISIDSVKTRLRRAVCGSALDFALECFDEALLVGADCGRNLNTSCRPTGVVALMTVVSLRLSGDMC